MKNKTRTYEIIRQEIVKNNKKRFNELNEKIRRLECEKRELEEKNEELQDKINTLNDWAERMQTYMNLSSDELRKLMELSEVMEASKPIISAMHGIMGVMNTCSHFDFGGEKHEWFLCVI